MTQEMLKKAWKAEPFEPFRIRTADGREYNVPHPDFIMLSPSGRTVVVADSDETFEMIDLLLVASIHVGDGRRRQTRKR